MPNRSLTIVMVTAFPPPIGGVSMHSARLVHRLAHDGFRVRSIDIALNRSKPDQLGRNLWSLLQVVGDIFRRRQVVWHFHASRRALPFWFAMPFLFLFRQRVILSLHTGDYVDDDRMVNRYLSISDKAGVLACVVVMNAALAARIRDQNARLAAKIIAVSPYIASPIDWSYILDVRANASNGEQNVIRVSTMGLWRNLYCFEDVVAATTQAARLTPEIIWELDIIASTAHVIEPYRAAISSLIESKSENNIRFRIIENIQNGLSYFATRHVFVRAAETDSFGLCVAEAIQAGCITMATNVCARPSAAVLFPAHAPALLADELLRVARNAPRSGAMQMELGDVDGYRTLVETYGAVALLEGDWAKN